MNRDLLEGNWKELKGKVQTKWGDLTNDDLDKIEGSRTELIGKLQQIYGKSREEAEREVDDFEQGR
ncbi:CsbD family protein [Vibrio sp. AK197]|uniref:CsbD family protein n=1 Tax=Vibrio olivae TaxID=1243002 RepID=A0ABV5HM82_9VIBR